MKRSATYIAALTAGVIFGLALVVSMAWWAGLVYSAPAECGGRYFLFSEHASCRTPRIALYAVKFSLVASLVAVWLIIVTGRKSKRSSEQQ